MTDTFDTPTAVGSALEEPTNGPRYESRAIPLLALSIGALGFDRWLIGSLFPAVGPNLGLTYQDLGNLSAALGLAFGVVAFVAGPLSDRIGRRQVIIPALVAFSLFSALSGVVTGLASLLLVRTLLGAAEGAFLPTMYASAVEASKPSRRGRNMGLLISCFPLFGLGAGPIIATQLLGVVPDWRWVFFLSALPGLVLTVLVAKTLRNRQNYAVDTHQITDEPAFHGRVVARVFGERNLVIALAATCLGLGTMFVLGAITPSYLTGHLGFGIQTAGAITSAVGFGGFAGQILLSGLSDRFGRRPMMVTNCTVAAIFILIFTRLDASPVLLFLSLFVAAAFAFALMSLLAGPITGEAAPRGLLGAANGIVIGGGEIFGGGVAPAIAGAVAQHFGIAAAPLVAVACMLLAAMLGLFLNETAPQVLSRRVETRRVA